MLWNATRCTDNGESMSTSAAFLQLRHSAFTPILHGYACRAALRSEARWLTPGATSCGFAGLSQFVAAATSLEHLDLGGTGGYHGASLPRFGAAQLEKFCRSTTRTFPPPAYRAVAGQPFCGQMGLTTCSGLCGTVCASQRARPRVVFLTVHARLPLLACSCRVADDGLRGEPESAGQPEPVVLPRRDGGGFAAAENGLPST